MADQRGIIRFGIFEINLAAAELRKNGTRIKLQEQPFQVLAALLQRPGEIVTKEELKEKIWSGDTFVDFDHSLSTAVNKIREALGDSASSPRFIETVPRRGYRFVGGTAASVAAGTAAVTATSAFATRRKTVGVIAAAVAASALLAVFGLSRRGSETKPALLPEGPIPLTTLPGREESPALSPDGTRVAFSWTGESGENVDIYVQVVGSSHHLRLTSDPGRDTAPAWSPDGRQIAFERTSSSGRALYLMSPLGGSETRVAEVFDVLGGGGPGIAWASDGKSIFYVAPAAVGAAPAIHRLVFETGEKQQLTFPPVEALRGDRRPTVSPDGRTLAFERGGLITREIWALPLAGGEPRKLTSQGGNTQGNAWTPDSREIVYSRSRTLGGTSFWRIAVGGGEPRLMPEIGTSGQFPTISSKGSRLAYESPGLDMNVWLYPMPGEENVPPPRPVNPSTQSDADARISPDGNRITFCSNRSGRSEVWVCNRDGSGLRRLTSLSGGSGSPRWSPDGRRIAFDSAQGSLDNWDIYVADALGGAPRRLTTHEGLDARPSWSRDGLWIYFTSDRGGMRRIWKLPAEGGEAVALTGGPADTQPFESHDGRFLYFSRELERSGIWRVPVEGGEAVATGLTFPLSGGQAWDVTEKGIYFAESRESVDLTIKWFLRLLPFDAPEAVDVMEIPGHFGTGATPLDIAPDGKWFAYTRNEAMDSDLMYLENFE